MITALYDSGQIVSPSLPKVGETIYIKDLGHALVEMLFHNARGNFIKLELQETVLGKMTQEFPFYVQQK